MKKAKKIIVYSVLAVAVAFAAVVAGFFSGNVIAFKLRRQPDYDFDVKAFTESITDVSYKKGESPADRVASDAFIIASHLLNQKPKYHIIGKGLVDTGLGRLGTMQLWGNAKKQNDEIETSIVAWNKVIGKYQVGLGYTYDLKTELIDFSYGKSYSDGSVTWGEPEKITVDDYEKEWGLHPSNFFTYTISSKTALRNDYPTTTVKNGETLYNYSLLLDTQTSVANYAKQLKKMSGLDNYPVFSYIQFNFTLDQNFTLRSVTINEKYSIYIYGVLVKCDANISYDFNYSL